ncbi:MAG: type III polyketide synthase [Hydrogenophaga sp.]
MFTPGPDHHVAAQLGLRNNVQRYTLGFMGCCAALPALRMAAQFCEADPQAVVMVICVEISTIHFQLDTSDDTLRGNALFGDGAAGAIVSARPLRAGTSGYAVRGFETSVIPNSAREMAWRIGDHGFELKLSSYVPDIVGFNVPGLVHTLLGDATAEKRGALEWAVHPGGPGILEQVQAALQLDESHTQASWQVLAENGNMSSATVLFVLRKMLLREIHPGKATVALAFGPGLTAEAAHLERAYAGQ